MHCESASLKEHSSCFFLAPPRVYIGLDRLVNPFMFKSLFRKKFFAFMIFLTKSWEYRIILQSFTRRKDGSFLIDISSSNMFPNKANILLPMGFHQNCLVDFCLCKHKLAKSQCSDMFVLNKLKGTNLQGLK